MEGADGLGTRPSTLQSGSVEISPKSREGAMADHPLQGASSQGLGFANIAMLRALLDRLMQKDVITSSERAEILNTAADNIQPLADGEAAKIIREGLL
jgi:hypothetical protein